MRPYFTALILTLGGAAVALAAIDQPVKVETGMISGVPGKNLPASAADLARLCAWMSGTPEALAAV